jgi:hypothetical protein
MHRQPEFVGREALSALALARSGPPQLAAPWLPTNAASFAPITNELEPWLRAKLALISQKTKLAEPIRYALSRWRKG